VPEQNAKSAWCVVPIPEQNAKSAWCVVPVPEQNATTAWCVVKSPRVKIVACTSPQETRAWRTATVQKDPATRGGRGKNYDVDVPLLLAA
jgi:hypothetical protein